jgi:hypothetical protein
VTWIQINIPLLSFIYARLVPATGDPQTASFFLGGLTAGYPRLAAGWNGDFALVYHDINFSFDWGSYGWLIGNRQYLPHVKK